MSRFRWQGLGLILLGCCVGVAIYALIASRGDAQSAGDQTASARCTLQPLTAADLKAVQDKLGDQSHAMQDVAYHFSNLWFAAKHDNWDLAQFYAKETRSHLQWAVRIKPQRKDNSGQVIDLVAILQAMENGPLKQVLASVEAKDKPTFEHAYRFMLEGCYGCHKAADKPYLRPQIPARPESTMINFDPAASWPK